MMKSFLSSLFASLPSPKDSVLALLLLGDLAFIVIHIIHTYTSLFDSGVFSIARDQGFAEMYQYTKELAIFVLFAILAWRMKKLLYFMLGSIFFLLMLDDSLRGHEEIGALLANALNLQPAFGLRAVDFGEILVAAILGGLFLLITLIGFLRADAQGKRVAVMVLLFLGLLGFFGIAFDMLAMANEEGFVHLVLTLFEEGGEMAVISLLTWYVFRLNFSGFRTPAEALNHFFSKTDPKMRT